MRAPSLPVVIPAALHCTVALFCWSVLGVDMHSDPNLGWDDFWQTVPMEELRANLLANVVSLHGQPPLFNLLVGVFAKLSDHPLSLLQACYIGLGSGMCAMASSIVAQATGDSRIGLTTASVLALHPALVLFEAYPLYTLPTAFLIMTALYAMSRFERDRREAWLLGFVATITLAVLFRSLYHVALLGTCIALACWLSERRGRVLLLALLIALPALVWSARGVAVHGTSGGSSWSGCNLFKIAITGYTPPERIRLLRGGQVSRIAAQVPVFSLPSTYRRHGFDASSGKTGLDRNDHNNINMPAICNHYGRSAIGVIAHDPLHYLGNVWVAYGRFGLPSTMHGHLDANRAKVAGWEGLVSESLLGHALTARSADALGRDVAGSVFFLLIPLSVALPLLGVLRAGSGKRRSAARKRPLLPVAAFLIAYTLAVGCLADLGENERFKFLIELPVLCVMVACGHDVWKHRASVSTKGGST